MSAKNGAFGKPFPGSLVPASGAELSAQINALAGTGRGIQLQAGNQYTLNAGALNATPGAIGLVGPGGRPVSAAAGPTITVSNVPALGTLNLVGWYLRGICLTYPATAATNPPLFGGSGTHDLTIVDCLFSDYYPWIARATGDQLVFIHNRTVLVAAVGGARVQCGIYNVLSNMVVRDNEFDALPQGAGVTQIVVGWNGLSATFFNFWIEDNSFGFGGGTPWTGLDTAIDLEAGIAGSLFQNCWVRGNVFYNAKTDLNAGDNIWITDNTYHFTTAYTNAIAVALYIIKTGANPIGDVHFEGNHCYWDDGVGTGGYNVQAVLIAPELYISALYIRRNIFIVDGAAGNPGNPGLISYTRQSTSNAIGCDLLVIEDNDFGFTSVPSTLGPIVGLKDLLGTGTSLTTLKVSRNRLMGATAATNYSPAMVGGAVATGFLKPGTSGSTSVVSTIECFDNDVSPAGNSLATLPIMLTASLGTLTVTTLKMWGNLPAVLPAVVTLPASGSAYTNADGNAEQMYVGQDLANSITSIAIARANSGGDGYTLTQNLGGLFDLNPGDTLTCTFVTTKPLAHKRSL